VEPSLRRQGLGRALLRHAMGRGREAGATRGLLEVRASNGTAIQLYEQEGFRRVAVRARYYTSPVEDAVLMERALDHS
jgi:ribosomal-protein-alanine N-acetyltransferase